MFLNNQVKDTEQLRALANVVDEKGERRRYPGREREGRRGGDGALATVAARGELKSDGSLTLHAPKGLDTQSTSEPYGESGPQHHLVGIGAEIRSKFLSHLVPLARNRRDLVSTCFLLDWTPHQFIEKQGYDNLPSDKVLDHVICLTGTWRQAQAMTVSEYMAQTWPATHQPLRELVNSSIMHRAGCHFDCMCRIHS